MKNKQEKWEEYQRSNKDWTFDDKINQSVQYDFTIIGLVVLILLVIGAICVTSIFYDLGTLWKLVF